MAAHFEESAQYSTEVDARPRLLFELEGELAELRARAEERGMLSAEIFYIIPGPDRELRVSTRPISLKKSTEDAQNKYLYVVLNQVEAVGLRGWHVHGEEYLVSEKGIAMTPHYGFVTADDQLKAPQQMPVIWESKADKWAVFRGNQTFWVPNNPHRHFAQDDLEGEVAMATNLRQLFSQLTIGCEDGNYPLS
jgi:hypothetical protein